MSLEVKATGFVDNAVLFYGDDILANTFSDESYYFVSFCKELVRSANGLGMQVVVLFLNTE
jgi:hypothetical protein